MEQRTDDWFKARFGCATASMAEDFMAGVDTAKYKSYLYKVVAETMTGEQQDSFTNSAMEWGTEQEPNARRAYEFLYDVEVEEVGFIRHAEIDRFGASPDGLVLDGLIEIKCPKTTTHIEYMDSDKIPPKYQKQMTCQMMVTGTKWCDFVSYDPRLPVDIQLWVKRYEFDQKLADKIEESVKRFIADVDATIQKLRKVAA